MPEKPSPPENYFQFERLLASLARHNVDFAMVGGVAVSLNGFVRATDDVDILVHQTPGNVRKLLHCLSQWGEGRGCELRLEDFRPRLRYLQTGDARIPYLSLEDLIVLKDGSWREKDQIDVAALRGILRQR